MIKDSAKLAAAVAVAYVLFFMAGVLVHYWRTGEEYTLYYSLTLPSTWLASIVALIIAYGLWRHRIWAWWLGTAAVVWQLVAISAKILSFFSEKQSPPVGMLIVLALFGIFLFLLALPRTRALCKDDAI